MSSENLTEVAKDERGLLGLIILSPDVIDSCEIELGAYEWTDPVCAVLWPVFCEMRITNEPIGDMICLAATVGQRLNHVGGLSVIGRLTGIDAGQKGNEVHYVRRLVAVMENSRLRHLGNEIHRKASSGMGSPQAIRDWIVGQLAAVPAGRVASDSIGNLMREIVDSSRHSRPAKKVKTGISKLDQATGGLRPGQLVILAARPSVGKSALAAQIAIAAAQDSNAVLFISMEMTSTEYVSRALASETGFPMQSILDGRLSSYEITKAQAVADAYLETPLLIADRRSLTVDRLASLVRSESARRKLGLVVVDYLGLIQPTDRKKPRWESITEISQCLKSLAQSELVPILALSQLNRECEGETPKLSHLRDSGAIEQDADIVLLLHRATRQSTETDLIIAKNRNGMCGVLELSYQASRFLFEEVTTAEEWVA